MDESTPSPPGVCAFANHYFCSPGQSRCARGFPYYHHSEEQLRAQRFGSCHCCGECLIDCVANSTCRCPETRPWSALLFLSALADSCSRCPFSRAWFWDFCFASWAVTLPPDRIFMATAAAFSSRSPPKVTSIPRWKTSSSSCGRRRRQKRSSSLPPEAQFPLGLASKITTCGQTCYSENLVMHSQL